MATITETRNRNETEHRRTMRAHLIANLGLICEELERRGRPVNEPEREHFHRLVMRTVEHFERLL